MDRWTGKTAVVTGASAGIGAAIAVALANAGVNVLGFARRPNLIEKLQEQVIGKGRIHARGCDVSNLDEITKSFEWVEENFGGVDILVNNAAVIYHGQIADGQHVVADSEIISQIDINIKGVVLCTRQAVKSMKKRNFNGHIVNINSIAGHYVPFTTLLNIYTSTKHAITAFTLALSGELAEVGQGIRTTSISPGLVATDMATIPCMPELNEAIKSCPILQPSDVADAVLYAVSAPAQVNISEITIQPVGEKRM